MISLSVDRRANMDESTGQLAEPSGAHALVQETFERCGQALCRYFTVRVRGDSHLVDDLMQQLWLQARLHCGALRHDAAEPWLWRIAQNLLRAHWRRQGRTSGDRIQADPALARSLGVRFDTEDLPADTLARQEVRDQLLLALTELSASTQELLIGCYFEDRSQADMAITLGITERAVEGRLYRARLALRDKLAHLGIAEE